MIKFTELSKNDFIQCLIEDKYFYSVAQSNGCDRLVYADIITEFAKECIYMMEEEEVYPYNKRYMDVSYYILVTQDGDDFIADMDTFWEMWNLDWEEGLYENR